MSNKTNAQKKEQILLVELVALTHQSFLVNLNQKETKSMSPRDYIDVIIRNREDEFEVNRIPFRNREDEFEINNHKLLSLCFATLEDKIKNDKEEDPEIIDNQLIGYRR